MKHFAEFRESTEIGAALAGPPRLAGAKRVLDLALVLGFAPILVPAVALLWCAVRLDGGPGFYAQIRVGRGGRTFRCWKLRSMVPGADIALAALCAEDQEIAREWEVRQKLAFDPRITRLGRFLRAASLDELPQLWNVLMGEMSLVGPRPFTPAQEPLYRAAGGTGYYALRPGVTGPWQIEGRGTTAFAARAAYDNAYARDRSLAGDLGLLLRTIPALFARRGG